MMFFRSRKLFVNTIFVHLVIIWCILLITNTMDGIDKCCSSAIETVPEKSYLHDWPKFVRMEYDSSTELFSPCRNRCVTRSNMTQYHDNSWISETDTSILHSLPSEPGGGFAEMVILSHRSQLWCISHTKVNLKLKAEILSLLLCLKRNRNVVVLTHRMYNTMSQTRTSYHNAVPYTFLTRISTSTWHEMNRHEMERYSTLHYYYQARVM